MINISQRQPVASASREVWQRWMLFWYGLFYGSLIIATGLALTLEAFSWEKVLVLPGLSLVLSVWYGICILVPLRYWREHAYRTLGYLAAGWLLWFALVNFDSAYLLVLTGLYPQSFVLVTSPRSFIGGGGLLCLSLWYQVSRGGWNENAFFILGTWVAGMLMTLFIDMLVRQSRERARLIEELQATRQELALAERRAGTIQERQRLAREIHDTFTQGFTSIIMQIEALEVGESPFKRTLEQVQRIARENLMEARRLLWALQPEAFEQTSLPEVLTSLARRWSEESGIAASAFVTGDACPLRPEIEVTLLRAAQELLANVYKHAQASAVVLTLSYLDEVVLLDIQDDGRGFVVQSLSPALPGQVTGGFGLKALRERVEQLAGTLTLESRSGEGTTVAVALPALANLSLVTPESGREQSS